MAAIFTYGFEIARQNFENAELKLICLSDYEAMLPQAIENNYASDEDLQSLAEWRKSPDTWEKE